MSTQGVQPALPNPAYPYVVSSYAADGSEIRKFSDQRIASEIDNLIASANLDPGQHFALVVKYHDDPTSNVLRGAVMFRKDVDILGKTVEWSFGGVLSHDFDTGDTTKEAGMVVKL